MGPNASDQPVPRGVFVHAARLHAHLEPISAGLLETQSRQTAAIADDKTKTSQRRWNLAAPSAIRSSATGVRASYSRRLAERPCYYEGGVNYFSFL